MGLGLQGESEEAAEGAGRGYQEEGRFLGSLVSESVQWLRSWGHKSSLMPPRMPKTCVRAVWRAGAKSAGFVGRAIGGSSGNPGTFGSCRAVIST